MTPGAHTAATGSGCFAVYGAAPAAGQTAAAARATRLRMRRLLFLRSTRVHRNRPVPLEPADRIQDLREHVARSRIDFVRSARNAHQRRVDLAQLQRLVELLRLRARRAVIVLAGD